MANTCTPITPPLTPDTTTNCAICAGSGYLDANGNHVCLSAARGIQGSSDNIQNFIHMGGNGIPEDDEEPQS